MVLVVKKEGSLKGIKMGNYVTLPHFLFVDDVILLGRGFVREVRRYK
jgi:hypothetical protein